VIPEDLEALVIADSIGALDEDECAALKVRLEGLSPADVAEIAAIYEWATSVATPLEAEPPPYLRERVLAAIQRPPAAGGTTKSGN
jgi:hypothetical protein